MFRQTSCALLVALLCTPSSAVRVLPGSPFAPGTPPRTAGTTPMPSTPSTVSTWQDARFELLISVRALTDVLQQDRRSLDAAQRQAAQQALRPLTEQATLDTTQARTRQGVLEAALGRAGVQRMQEARLKLEQRAHLQLSSSRYARGEEFPDMATYRLALLVPGGQATVRAMQNDASKNPFLQGVPATALKKLLLLLD